MVMVMISEVKDCMKVCGSLTWCQTTLNFLPFELSPCFSTVFIQEVRLYESLWKSNMMLGMFKLSLFWTFSLVFKEILPVFIQEVRLYESLWKSNMMSDKFELSPPGWISWTRRASQSRQTQAKKFSAQNTIGFNRSQRNWFNRQRRKRKRETFVAKLQVWKTFVAKPLQQWNSN